MEIHGIPRRAGSPSQTSSGNGRISLGKKKVMEPMVKWVLLPENIDVIRGNLYMLGHIMGNLNLWHVKIMIMICLILET